MKQVASRISTYAADISGLCSALYELGGMCVMHDASGCNSTYSTHDEPRWYDMDSAVYITALSEIDAVMGDDEKTINDICEAAEAVHPKFIAIGGTPIPMMIGTDFNALARVVERRTGIPSFGFNTNGMHSYTVGASRAFDMLANNFVQESEHDNSKLSCNIIGLTPLDFSLTGYEKSLRKFLEENDFNVISTWAMGSTLEDIGRSSAADVNLVVSYSGLKAAKTLEKKFGIPYVISMPAGEKLCEETVSVMKEAAETEQSKILFDKNDTAYDYVIIGESVMSMSLAKAIKLETGLSFKVICPLDADCNFGAVEARDEDELIPVLKTAKAVIADPLYKPICPDTAEFIELPHFAFSGRIWKDAVPDYIKDFVSLMDKLSILK